MKTNDVWVAMYSKDQNAYHIETLDETVKKSRGMLARGVSNDYMIIGVCENFHEANKICDAHKKINPVRNESSRKPSWTDL